MRTHTMSMLFRMMRLAALPFAALAFGALATPQGCAGGLDGFHSIRGAWSDSEVGLVWLERRSETQDAVVFARAGVDAKIKGRYHVVAKNAFGSAPPLIASDGSNFRIMYTHAGKTGPGTYTLRLKNGRGVGQPTRIADEPVMLCSDMSYDRRIYTAAWTRGGRIEWVRFDRDSDRPEATVLIDDPGPVASCRLVAVENGYRLVWQTVGDQNIVVAAFTPKGVLQKRRVLTGPNKLLAAGLDDNRLSLVRTARGGGAERVRLDARLDEQEVHDIDRHDWVFTSAALLHLANTYLAWTDAPSGGRMTAHVAVLEEDGGLDRVQRLGEMAKALPSVTGSSDGRRGVLGFSNQKRGGLVGWIVFRSRADGSSVSATGTAGDITPP